MSECDLMRETMPLLLSESLDPARRELSHQHIEQCAACNREWLAYRETWRMMGDLPEVEVPARVRERFLASIPTVDEVVVPFRKRPAARWLAQAAAVVLLVGGSYWVGHRGAAVRLQPTPATINAAETLNRMPGAMAFETRAALIQALKSDPNPSVRLKAIEALTSLARSGVTLDPAAVDMLRQKASQDDENLYVRVKAAEALSNI